jgi:hypothetical protein
MQIEQWILAANIVSHLAENGRAWFGFCNIVINNVISLKWPYLLRHRLRLAISRGTGRQYLHQLPSREWRQDKCTSSGKDGVLSSGIPRVHLNGTLLPIFLLQNYVLL